VDGQRSTGYLKPALFALYLDGEEKALLTQAGMRLDASGNTEVLQAFWNLPPNEKYPDVVPPLLAYADLMATEDGCNLETARLIYESFSNPYTVDKSRPAKPKKHSRCVSVVAR
jgi:hypothetical protein